MAILELLASLKDNPTALAIMGGAPIAAGITYVLRYLTTVPKTIIRYVKLHYISQLEIFEPFADGEGVYNRTISYFKGLDNKMIKNNLKISHSGEFEIGEGSYFIIELLKSHHLLVYFRLSTITRDKMAQNNKGGSSKSKIHQINMSIYGSNVDRKRFLYELQEYVSIGENDTKVNLDEFFPVISETGIRFDVVQSFKFHHLRPMSSVYFDNKKKEELLDFVTRFINGESVYRKAHTPYKSGILLYGEPGTGKSSLVKAICSHFGLPMVIGKPNSDEGGPSLSQKIRNAKIPIDQSELTGVFNNLNVSTRYLKKQKYHERVLVVLLEEFDKFFEDKTDEYNSYHSTGAKIQRFLQLLDGVESPEGVLFIATTNYIDNIEPALLRKGRFDFKLEMNKMDHEVATQMINDMCPHLDPSNLIKEDEEINSSDLFTTLLYEQIRINTAQISENRGGNKNVSSI